MSKWPKFVPWHDAESMRKTHLPQEAVRVFSRLKGNEATQAWITLLGALDGVDIQRGNVAQQRADAWNAAMASLGYTEIYERSDNG